MKNKLIVVVGLVVIVGLGYFSFERLMVPRAINDNTGWQLPAFSPIKTLRSNWSIQTGETVWLIDKSLLQNEDLKVFESCQTISGSELSRRFSELAGQVESSESFCVVYKERKDEHIFIYLGKSYVIIHLGI